MTDIVERAQHRLWEYKASVSDQIEGDETWSKDDQKLLEDMLAEIKALRAKLATMKEVERAEDAIFDKLVPPLLP